MNINNHIKKLSLRNMIYPFSMAFIIILLLLTIPFKGIFIPTKLSSIWNCEKEASENEFVTVTVDELFYSGYNIRTLTSGDYGYYYSLQDNNCFFVLIPVSDKPQESLYNYTVTGEIVKTSSHPSFDNLMESMADDLNWSVSGLKSSCRPFLISDADYHPYIYGFIFALIVLGIILMCYLFAINIRHYFKPSTYNISPHYTPKDKEKFIWQINNELNNKVILNHNDIYLTKQFLIQISTHKLIVIPLKTIVWAYRIGSSNHISTNKEPNYNLCLLLRNADEYVFTKQPSESTRQILEELQKMNYKIILGYSKTKQKMANETVQR